jgi:hypothetical protein
MELREAYLSLEYAEVSLFMELRESYLSLEYAEVSLFMELREAYLSLEYAEVYGVGESNPFISITSSSSYSAGLFLYQQIEQAISFIYSFISVGKRFSSLGQGRGERLFSNNRGK